MFTSSKQESSGIIKKATGAYLAYKALPFGSKKKDEGSLSRKVLGGYVALKTVPTLIKWVGGGALLFYAANYAYSHYNSNRLSSVDDEI